MSRLSDTFAGLQEKSGGKTALVTYIAAGDPDLDATVPAMHAMVEGGADVLELGIPFSDPEADGPVIQAASERALAKGVRFDDVLQCVAKFRETNTTTPVVLMGYLNSVLAQSDFATRVEGAGVDGLIMVNLPPEEAESVRQSHIGQNLDLIFLVAPTTSDTRMQLIAQHARGFLYYVSFKGITGASHLEVGEVTENVARLKQYTPLPVCVGFGIKDGTTAQAVGAIADGVVVGTAMVNCMVPPEGNSGDVQQIAGRLTAKTSELRQALDR